jgi:uncharacterized protein
VSSFRWRRLDRPGTDRATLTTTDNGYLLLGHAQFSDPAGEADLHYSVQVSPTWRTERAHLQGVGPTGPVQFQIAVQSGGLWTLNGQLCPEVTSCIDLDLNLTPATNLLSIRRLRLAPDEMAEVVAAWLEFPAPRLRPLRQLYRHLGGGRYDYRCPELPFATVLETNSDGFVTSYPPLWEPESAG